MPSSDRHRAPSRRSLAISVVLIASCAFAAFWVSTVPGGPPLPAMPSLAAPHSDDAAARPARRLYVPLSPLAQTDVQAVGGTRTRPGDWLRMELPPTLPPSVRIPSLPITIPLRPGFFADEGSGYDQFHLGDEFEGSADGALPLLWIAGEEDAWLTPNFRVADFASRDGGTTARISYRLVEGLERLRTVAGSLGIISGYRNVAHNAAVGGVAHSQHLEGKAADVWSADQTPLDLARLALQTLGCQIGLGLGPRSLHIDVRGDLLTWTYPGAAMPNAAFDAWALAQCGLEVPPELAQQAAEAWLDDAFVTALDTLYDDASPADLLARYHTSVMEAARAGYDLEGPGAIVLDLSAGVPPSNYLPPSYLRYVRAGTPEATSLGVASLIAWRERGQQRTYFVYAVLTPAAAPAVGVSSFVAIERAPAAAPPSALGADEASPPPSTASIGETWTVVVASHLSPNQAEASAEQYRAALSGEGYLVAVTHDRAANRYRVTAGQFRTSAAAQSALDRLGGKVPSDAWVYRR